MEVIWTLLLIACFTDTDCRYQQFFDNKQECIVLKTELEVEGWTLEDNRLSV